MSTGYDLVATLVLQIGTGGCLKDVHRLHLPTLTWRGPLPLHPASAPVQSGGGFTAQGLVSGMEFCETLLIISADCFVCIDLLRHGLAIKAHDIVCNHYYMATTVPLSR